MIPSFYRLRGLVLDFVSSERDLGQFKKEIELVPPAAMFYINFKLDRSMCPDLEDFGLSKYKQDLKQVTPEGIFLQGGDGSQCILVLYANVYGSSGSLGREDPIINSCHQGSEVVYAPCLQESSLQDWIAVEVSRVVHEELPNIIERVTGRVTARFQDQTATLQAVGRVVGVNRKQEIGLDVHLGKRCGWKGHKRQECTLEEELCHRCHQPGHIKANCPRIRVKAAPVSLQILRLGGIVQVPSPMVPQEVKIEAQ
ncbi:unnamed protein product [Lactuca saligna]|uniref:CCHC-type domain-containing protein n=1 Tax=Lactuca saligna TaxID=75948 RepID=A0AA35ZNT3_LACSI|nr:unnamed protein product [Lactuca saligna]